MTNQNEITKFEFLLTLDGNIVCQRFFNVKDYNPTARRSMDLYNYIKNISEEINEELKIKTLDFLSENQNYFMNFEDVEEMEDEKKEDFLIEIKLNEDVFISRISPAHYYHPKVRYTVDIRPKLKRILSDLTDILSLKELDTTYLNCKL
jgi:hypothetical protein